jgi:hypothetical protein
MPSLYRYDGTVQTPLGLAVDGADVAVLTDPSDFSTQPGSPLATIFAADASNAATITGATWMAGQILFTFSTTPPADVVPNSFIAVSGVLPATYDTTLEAPYLVVSVVGNVVTVAELTNPGAYVSGGTVATSVLPNPLPSGPNGNFFFYAASGLYGVQIYYSTVEMDFPDQGVGFLGGGSVTSVALTVPSRQTVTGSPITGASTLAITDNTETANLVFAGPTSGSAAAPTFRALVSADLPGGFGTVSSVGLTFSVPAMFTIAITGSPVTTSGTLGLTLGLATESANTALLGPTTGSAAPPTFRALVAADLPGAVLSVATLALTTAQIKALHGTPIQIVAAPSAGQVLVPIAATLQYKFLTAAYTNTSGASIMIAASAVLGTTNEPIQFVATGLIDQTASQFAIGASDSEAMPITAVSAAALLVGNEGGSGEFATGSGTAIITLWYMTITLS